MPSGVMSLGCSTSGIALLMAGLLTCHLGPKPGSHLGLFPFPQHPIFQQSPGPIEKSNKTYLSHTSDVPSTIEVAGGRQFYWHTDLIVKKLTSLSGEIEISI